MALALVCILMLAGLLWVLFMIYGKVVYHVEYRGFRPKPDVSLADSGDMGLSDSAGYPEGSGGTDPVSGGEPSAE